MTDESGTARSAAAVLQRLQSEHAIEQLRRREGRMAELGSENGVLKLDWVEGVARLLEDPTRLEEVEAEARALWQQGIRHIIWAGMGGSIITVRVLAELGFCDGHNGEHVAIYPLDSTDPAALNDIVRRIAQAKQLTLPTSDSVPAADWLRTLLDDVMMVGVAMGMTSEEPITHLTWFTGLLVEAQLSPAEHLLVMTLPGSYLDLFAQEQQAPSRPLQLDGGNGTGGRMSAPTTRVFLLPVALYLTRLSKTPGQLRMVLRDAWRSYNLDLAANRPAEHPFVQLAAAAVAASQDGACRLLLALPGKWQALLGWIEQLMEESLGKGDKGIVMFGGQTLNAQAPDFHAAGTLFVSVNIDRSGAQTQETHTFHLHLPYLAEIDPRKQLAAAATSFLSWQLTMALYGYLQHIPFAGQPAVENYKARARALRSHSHQDPLSAVQNWDATFTEGPLALLAPRGTTAQGTPAQVFAAALTSSAPSYLDFTINGEVPATLRQTIADALYPLGNTLLGVPVKLRQAPADYHSTEQGEMDGLPGLVSLRLLAREHEHILLGSYTDTFLRAQAVSTWQAMIEQGRTCFLLLVDSTAEQAVQPVQHFFAEVTQQLTA